MNILNINSYYFSSSVHKQLKHALDKQGVKNTSYIPLAKVKKNREDDEITTEENLIISECYNKLDRYIFHYKHKKIMNNLINSVKIQDYDLLHAHSLFSNGYIALQVKRKYGIPYIVTVRDTDLNTFFKSMIHLRKLGIQILTEADKIIFLSKPYRDFLLEKYVPELSKQEILIKSEIKSNGIDSFWLKNKSIPQKIQHKKDIKLIYIGKINKRKNINTTLEAIKILRNKGYNVEFTIIGKVVDASIYQQLIKLPYVEYFPPMLQEEIIKKIRQKDIFVMPSITETFGLVYAEAMTQGLPIIYSKNQGFDGQFKEGTVGFHVDSLNPQYLAENVISIMRNYEEISKNCINLSKKFDWNLIASEYIETYKNII